jgi:hypothetical protein
MCMSMEDKNASWVGCVWIHPITMRFLERTVSRTCCGRNYRVARMHKSWCANLFSSGLAVVAARQRVMQRHPPFMLSQKQPAKCAALLTHLLPFCCGTMTVDMTSESPLCTPPRIAHVSTFLDVFPRDANIKASMACELHKFINCGRLAMHYCHLVGYDH